MQLNHISIWSVRTILSLHTISAQRYLTFPFQAGYQVFQDEQLRILKHVYVQLIGSSWS